MNHDWLVKYEFLPLRQVHYTIVAAPTRPAATRKVHVDRPGSSLHILKVTKHQKPSLPDRLDDLASQMHNVATELEYYGGFDSESVQHAHELLGASTAVKTWAAGLRDKEAKE